MKKTTLQNFDEIASENGRIIIPFARLKDCPQLDTALDLEIKISSFSIKNSNTKTQENCENSLKNGGIQTQENCENMPKNAIKGGVFAPLFRLYSGSKEVLVLTSDGIYSTELASLENELPTYDNQILALFIKGDSGFDKGRYCFSDLIRIMRRLTAKDGCEWDKVQTHDSIMPNLIEEAYEAAAAVMANSNEEMCEEFGDVLLQTVLNCDIAERNNQFTIDDCLDTLCKKLYTRHTHIFGVDNAGDQSAALGFWERAKEKEKNYSGALARIEKIPRNLPALMLAQKTIKAILKERPITKDDLLNGIGELKNREVSAFILFLCAYYSLSGGDAETDLLRRLEKLVKDFKNSNNTESILALLKR